MKDWYRPIRLATCVCVRSASFRFFFRNATSAAWRLVAKVRAIPSPLVRGREVKLKFRLTQTAVFPSFRDSRRRDTGAAVARVAVHSPLLVEGQLKDSRVK